MRVTTVSRAHQSSPPAVSLCRGLRRSESAISFGACFRLSGSARPPPPLRRSSSATCYFSDHRHLKRPEREPFRPSKVELLEPSILGIRPEAPNWPAREDLMRDWIARRANCVELPLSLRIIKEKKKKNQMREEGAEMDSIAKAFSCTVQVIRELQNHALRLRALTLEEGVEPAVDKIQSEMDSCFVWLFREVFSRTPDLMANVMVLTVDFAAHSLEKQKQQEGEEQIAGIMSSSEKMLWDSMVEEASRCGQEEQQQFISPVRVQIQGDDDYEDYNRTELLYQIGVFQEPNNPLLLCNYAQFLCLVTHNYDRAEECFERAVQVDPLDGEVLSQYATFLWVVRKDIWGAEERYQQAMAAEPDNPFHASKYANFLWSTGGDDTCFPL
ncbi:hypothetical protein V2J09_016331 [Rumex salicifolius]